MEKVNYIRSKYHYSWILLREMVKTDFKLRYQGSILGIAWSALKPLMLFFVMYLVFVQFLKVDDKAIPNYPVVLLLGISVWSFVGEATSGSIGAVIENSGLIRKINMPKYLIVLQKLVSAAINLGINLVIVIVFAFIVGIHFTFNVFFVPFILLELFILVFAISLILSTLFVRFRDIGPIWEVFLQILFYATPIIWPFSYILVHSSIPGWVTKLILINPFAQIIQDIRFNLLAPIPQLQTVWNQIHQWYIAIIPILIVIILFVVAALYFRKRSKTFAEEA